MNKLETKDVLIEIPVTERLPTECFNTVNSGDSYKVAYFNKDKKPCDQWSTNISGTDWTFPEVWLEKQSGYFFTREELEAEFNKIWAASENRFFHNEYGPVPNPHPDQQTFIDNLF
jgi:hypothetical protein